MTEELIDPFDDEAPLEAAGWHIRNDEDANRYLRKLARLRATRDRLRDQAKAEHARIGERLASVLAAPENEIERVESALLDYRRWLEGLDPGIPKTYRLIDGDLCRRKQREIIEITKENAPTFIAWALEHEPELLRSNPEVDKQSARWDTLATTPEGELYDPIEGVIIPGVRRYRPDDVLAVSVPKPSLTIVEDPS